MTTIREDIERPESLDLSSETLAYLVLKARSFDAQTPPADSNEASNAADDRHAYAMTFEVWEKQA